MGLLIRDGVGFYLEYRVCNHFDPLSKHPPINKGFTDTMLIYEKFST